MNDVGVWTGLKHMLIKEFISVLCSGMFICLPSVVPYFAPLSACLLPVMQWLAIHMNVVERFTVCSLYVMTHLDVYWRPSLKLKIDENMYERISLRKALLKKSEFDCVKKP